MLTKILSWLVNLAIGALLVAFLIANRNPVAISLDPVNAADPAISSPALPLWFWLVIALLVGFFLGAAGMWLSGGDRRRRARDDRLTVAALRKENEILAARSTGEAPMLIAEG